MKCSNCSHENADDFLFCENCGEPLKKECPECGHENGLDFAFCEKCGHKFADKPAYFLASEELAQTETPAEPPLKRKQKTSSVPASEEAVPAQAPPPQVVVVQQEKRRRLPGWLWLVLVLFAAVIFFIIIGPRQPNYQPVASSAGQSGGSGNTSSGGQSSGSSGNTSSGGQTSSGSTGNTSSDSQPTNTPRPPDTESNLSPARITVDQDSNCRYGPSSAGFDIRETVFEGETVLIIGIGTGYAEEWFLVEVNGKDCWLWSGLGEVNGDTASLASISPPPIPVAEAEPDEPEQDEEEKNDGGQAEEQTDECEGLNPVAIPYYIGPEGAEAQVHKFEVSGFLPFGHVSINVYLWPVGGLVLFDDIGLDANGEVLFRLELGHGPGQQFLIEIDSGNCPEQTESASAVFINR